MALAIGRCSEFFDKTARARARSDELRYLSRCRFYGTQFLNPLHLLVLFEFLHQSARGRARGRGERARIVQSVRPRWRRFLEVGDKSAQARERRTGPGHYGAATGGWLLCTAPWPL